MAFVPLVQQQASEFGGNIDRPFPELRLGLSRVAVNAEKYAHAIGRLLIGIRLRQVTCSHRENGPPSSSNPALDRVEDNKDVLSYCIQLDLSQYGHHLRGHGALNLASFPGQPLDNLQRLFGCELTNHVVYGRAPHISFL